MDINVELDNIIKKYNLDEYYPQYSKFRMAEKVIHKILEGIHGRIAIVATDVCSIRRFKAMLSGREADYYCCNRRTDIVEDYDAIYNVSCLDNVDWNQYAWVWLVTMEGSIMMKRQLRIRGVQYRYLYDDLAMHGVVCDKEWDKLVCDPMNDWWSNRYSTHTKHDYVVTELMDLYNEYKTVNNAEIRVFLGKKLLFLALYVKDFLLAEKLVDKMPDVCHKEKRAWLEIKRLLNNIQEQFAKKKQRDICVIWTDAISYKHIEDVPYLKDKMSQGVAFENMYTVCPHTNPTFKSMVLGKMPVDDGAYDINMATLDNSALLNDLHEDSYDLCTISGRGVWGVIPQEYKSNYYHDDFQPASYMLWDLWRNLLMRDNPTLYIVHNLVETHSPFLSDYVDDKAVTSEHDRYIASCKYLNDQYKFYVDKLPKASYKIYMTDHGKLEFKYKYHTYMVIQGENIEPRKINAMCALVDFHKIIKQLIKTNNINEAELTREYVPIQDLDIYNKIFASNFFCRHEAVHEGFFGYHGIVTKEYIYIHFTDGREWFIRRDNDKFVSEPVLWRNYIYDESKVQHYRDIVRRQEENVPDFSEKLKYSSYIHKVYNNAKAMNFRKCELVNQEISQYPDKSIFVRLGGIYGRYVYNMLTEDNRKKIGGFVDLNPDCACAAIGLPIYTSIEQLPDSAKYILPSNENFIARAEKECAESKKNLQVLNFHEMLSEYGIKSNKCIALFQPSDEDYDVGFPFDEVT